LIAISLYLEAKFDYGYFIFFQWGTTILHKKCPVISSKIEGVMAIFAILDFCELFYQGLDIVTLHVIPFWNP